MQARLAEAHEIYEMGAAVRDEFLTELRLELASRKLRNTSLALSDVAAEAGYQSESSFSRAFRRRFGRPPGALRAGHT